MVQVDDRNKQLTNGTQVELTKSSSGLYSFPLGINAVYYHSYFLARLGVVYHHSFIGLGGTNKMTYSNDYLEHHASMQRLEIPLSFALRFLHSRAYGAYIGTGVDLFWGNNTSTMKAYDGSIGTTLTEKDSYSGFGFGFHFLLGIEAQLFDKAYLVVELFQNFGYSSLITDSEIDSSTESFRGTTEDAQPDEIQINFGGTEILISLRYFL